MTQGSRELSSTTVSPKRPKAPISETLTDKLRQLMAEADIVSFKALAQGAGVSEGVIRQVRSGQLASLRLEVLQKLSRALNLPVTELITQISADQASSKTSPPNRDLASQTEPSVAGTPEQSSRSTPDAELTALRQEYARLQAQLIEQQQQLRVDFQKAALASLESWLTQWPTAAYAAQQNPQAPAVRLLPLMKPIEALLAEWGVRAIASVGEEVPYDPTLHQLIEGTAQPGQTVRIRYTGYWHGERLLQRAKVSPV
ncbi:MAG TPA: helix-turn-helix domain-containing protein [Trichocoleus sp.]